MIFKNLRLWNSDAVLQFENGIWVCLL